MPLSRPAFLRTFLPMKKLIPALLITISLLLAACGTAQNVSVSSAQTSFTDDLGRTVTVDKPQRVACLIGSFADLWCLAGGADTIVASAADTWRYFDLPLHEDVINLGATKELNLEQLLSAEPDFIIASCNTDSNLAMQESFSEMGISAAYFDVSTVEDYLRVLKIMTEITGMRENFATYGESVLRQVENAKAMADGTQPSVLYVRASGSSCKVKNSDGSVLGEMLRDLDCRNIADGESSRLEQLSIEKILAEDPDFIFIILQSAEPSAAEKVLEETLLSSPAWETLTAVKEGRCFVLDQTLYNLKPNARWGDAYEQLAKLIYEK